MIAVENQRRCLEVEGFLGWQSGVVAGVEGVIGRSLEVGGVAIVLPEVG